MSDGFYPGSPLGLQMLMAEDLDLNHYFMSLPDEVRGEINQHAESFHSADDLYQFAEQLMQND